CGARQPTGLFVSSYMRATRCWRPVRFGTLAPIETAWAKQEKRCEMNVSDEPSRSCWMDDLPDIAAPDLTDDVACDVLIVGAGIAGLSTAYELARFGRTVTVIDRGRIGGGMTARTTAHLASALDDYYSELIKVRGADEARLYHDSQVAAINRIEAICRDEAIDADFYRVDGFL